MTDTATMAASAVDEKSPPPADGSVWRGRKWTTGLMLGLLGSVVAGVALGAIYEPLTTELQ